MVFQRSGRSIRKARATISMAPSDPAAEGMGSRLERATSRPVRTAAFTVMRDLQSVGSNASNWPVPACQSTTAKRSFTILNGSYGPSSPRTDLLPWITTCVEILAGSRPLTRSPWLTVTGSDSSNCQSEPRENKNNHLRKVSDSLILASTASIVRKQGEGAKQPHDGGG
jgi:hypothetical protein